jgi:hypothetical protein
MEFAGGVMRFVADGENVALRSDLRRVAQGSILLRFKHLMVARRQVAMEARISACVSGTGHPGIIADLAAARRASDDSPKR